MQAMTTDPLAGQPMAQPHDGVLLPVADIGPNPDPQSPMPPASPVPVLANPAAAALDSPAVPIRGSGSAGGAHPAPDRCATCRRRVCASSKACLAAAELACAGLKPQYHLSQTTLSCLRRPQTSELQSCMRHGPSITDRGSGGMHAPGWRQEELRMARPMWAARRLQVRPAARPRAGTTNAPGERADAAGGSAETTASAAAASGADTGGRGIFADSREERVEPAERAAQAAGPSVSVAAEPMAVDNSPGGQTGGGGGAQVGSEHPGRRGGCWRRWG